ncbi:MAG: hypothetical protein IJ576_01360, partial [Synergistaceae bacterium]|nr:hypothetical protein [Synergistaceae bacterium]
MRKFKNILALSSIILCALFVVFAEQAWPDFGNFSGSRGYNNSSSRSRSRSSSSSTRSSSSGSGYGSGSSSRGYSSSGGGMNIDPFVAGALMNSVRNRNNNSNNNFRAGASADADADNDCIGDNMATTIGL